WRRAPADAHQRNHSAGIVAIDGVQVGHVDPAITIVGHHMVRAVVHHYLSAIGETAQVGVAVAAFRQTSLVVHVVVIDIGMPIPHQYDVTAVLAHADPVDTLVLDGIDVHAL